MKMSSLPSEEGAQHMAARACEGGAATKLGRCGAEMAALSGGQRRSSEG
jgi:hypothetical protein